MNSSDIIKIISENEPVEAYELLFGKTWASGMRELIPEHMRPGLLNWIALGTPPGSFLCCVIENDLFGALRSADDINRDLLLEYATFFHNYAPVMCHGSRDVFEIWEKQGGMRALGA